MGRRDGAAATVRTLSQGGTEAAPSRYPALERGVASGEQQWLGVVPLIRPGADGENATGLTMSLGDAPPKMRRACCGSSPTGTMPVPSAAIR